MFEIVQKIERIDFILAGMISGLGPSNVEVWKIRDISIDNLSFVNPAPPDRRVYVFADAPHLTKLIRNKFLDSGFRFPDRTIVNSGCVRELIVRSASDLKTTHRL